MKPEKLSWVTVPMLFNMVLSGLGLLALPFMGLFLAAIFGSLASNPTTAPAEASNLGLATLFTGATLWIIGLLGLGMLALQFFAYRALQEGRSWGRIAAIVFAILGLLNFPIGTLFSSFMLIGAFDEGVQRYASR